MSDFFAQAALSPIVTLPLFAAGLIGLVAFFSKPGKKSAETSNQAVGWSAFEAVTVVIGIYLLSQVVGSVALGAHTVLMSRGAEQASQIPADGQFIFMAATDAVALLMVYIFLQRRKTSPRAIGWVRPRWVDLAYTLTGFFVYVTAYVALFALVRVLFPGLDVNQSQELGFSSGATGMALVAAFIGLVILPPLVEEILTRGVLYSGLKTGMPILWAALLTSVLFASAHLPEGKGGLLWVGAIDTFTLSMVLVYMREKTGSLWPGIGLHALKNGIAFLLLFVFHVV